MSQSRSIEGVSDLVLVVGLLAGTILALLVPSVPRLIEWGLSISFVLVLPGYVVVATLFPTAPSNDRTPTGHPNAPGWAVRAAMTLGISAIILSIVGTGLSLAGMLRLGPVVVSLSAIILAGAWIARGRRQSSTVDTPADPIGNASLTGRSDAMGLSGRQTVTLGISVLAFVGVLAFVAGTPVAGTPYTEATLLGDDGETLLGDNGTVALEPGQSNAVTLLLENQEGNAVTYGIVGHLQRVGPNGSVLETEQIDRGQVTLADNESVRLDRNLTPQLTGENLRLDYLIYKGSIPDDPGATNASLTLRQWVEVTSGG